MPALLRAGQHQLRAGPLLQTVHDNIGWDEKYPVRDMGNGKVRAVGMGMAMQAPALRVWMWAAPA